jgi:hypothetical protein
MTLTVIDLFGTQQGSFLGMIKRSVADFSGEPLSHHFARIRNGMKRMLNTDFSLNKSPRSNKATSQVCDPSFWTTLSTIGRHRV